MPNLQERIAVVEEQTKRLPLIEKKIDDLHDKLDKKFAGKWVEWFNKTLIGAVVLGGFSAIASAVAKALGGN